MRRHEWLWFERDEWFHEASKGIKWKIHNRAHQNQRSPANRINVGVNDAIVITIHHQLMSIK